MEKTPSASMFMWGTKAETLSRLSNTNPNFIVPELIYFSRREWENSKARILGDIVDLFGSTHVCVRSSAQSEDCTQTASAGMYESILNVETSDSQGVACAIDTVFSSFSEREQNGQIIIQKQIKNVQLSGVVMTRCIDDGSPYYTINYDDESQRTDSVTGGTGAQKCVLVYRHAGLDSFDSPRVRSILEVVRLIEEYCGNYSLDIEFALGPDNQFYLFQVRRICTTDKWPINLDHRIARKIKRIEVFIREYSKPRPGLFGERTILGNMPDWNPAEIIGVIPNPLALSLYRRLITRNVWLQARMAMGYRRMPATELLVTIGGRPYIDVRASFNSLLPEGIETSIGGQLVEGWLNRLDSHPQLHDKIEFSVVPTVMDFSFGEFFNQCYQGLLTQDELNSYAEKLTAFTVKNVTLSPHGSLVTALSKIKRLVNWQNETLPQSVHRIPHFSPQPAAFWINAILDKCIELGTVPFSIIARHAFMAEALLRSAVRKGALSEERFFSFKQNIHTVAGECSRRTRDILSGRCSRDDFFIEFGHLRAGTYNILSPCYENRNDLFTDCVVLNDHNQGLKQFEPTSKEITSLNLLLSESGLSSINGEELFKYADMAIRGREYAKFIFTKNVSFSLEGIALWGKHFGLGRGDLAYLPVTTIMETYTNTMEQDVGVFLLEHVERNRAAMDLSYALKLGYLLRGKRDLHVVAQHRSQPNYISGDTVEGVCLFIKGSDMNYGSPAGKIICIENADPGYDWVFSKGIKGLVTMYGGANSHMAIRCSEMGLPAAIGCGELMFKRIRTAGRIELNCREQSIKFIS